MHVFQLEEETFVIHTNICMHMYFANFCRSQLIYPSDLLSTLLHTHDTDAMLDLQSEPRGLM